MLEPIARVLTFLLSTKHSLRHIFNMKIDILISSRIHNDIVYVKKKVVLRLFSKTTNVSNFDAYFKVNLVYF